MHLRLFLPHGHNFVLQSSVLTLKVLFHKQQILDSSKLKMFADDNFKLNKSGRKVSKRAENTVGKREIGP